MSQLFAKPDSPDTILAVIPAYNEAMRVGDVITLARSHLPVLVIDDGSTDSTSQVAEEAGD